jgi:hypothetical protein
MPPPYSVFLLALGCCLGVAWALRTAESATTAKSPAADETQPCPAPQSCEPERPAGYPGPSTRRRLPIYPYTSVMADEATILEEAMENLNEAGQRIRATQSLMRSEGMTDGENYRDLLTRLSTALAMTEAAYLEARRRR